MAAQKNVEDVVKKVADGIHGFAKKHRWKPKDYRIHMVVNSMYWRLRVILYAKALSPQTEGPTVDVYNEVSDAIDNSLGEDDRDYFSYIGLILTNDQAHAEESGTARNASEFEIGPNLINRSSTSRSTTAKGRK
jgi:hypothetical protein